MKLVPIAAVNPSTYNPRTADPRRLDLIELSLRKLGWLLPIYADKHGEILSGHQRHHVAARMGLLQVPVEFTRAMDIEKRKAINIAFNRGTNDMGAPDTPKTLTEALERSDVYRLAERLPDIDPGDERFYRCMEARAEPIGPLLEANSGRWVTYARNLSRMLRGAGVHMPIVVTPDLTVVNGIGRLQYAAERGEKQIDVLRIEPHEADFASAMLNLLSMDFDIHNRYADLLRYNSFRRARRVRTYLGRGFTFAVLGQAPARELDITDPADLARWRAVHGESVIDFGAGHMYETELLRSQGIHVAAFEPYRLGSSDIDKPASIDCVRRFLEDIATGRSYSSVFLSSVLNSVPFAADRRHIACICAALCGRTTRLYAVASCTRQVGWRVLRGSGALNESSSNLATFALDYEPGIQIGDFQERPKVQKYHTQREFYALFKEFFGFVKVDDDCNNVSAVCSSPKPPDPEKLAAALAFEFDLPYPDGTRMGLVEEARAAFRARGLPC